MIMSVINGSVKMSVWGYGRETALEQERTESVNGVKCGGKGKGSYSGGSRDPGDFREAGMKFIGGLSRGGSCRISPWESREQDGSYPERRGPEASGRVGSGERYGP